MKKVKRKLLKEALQDANLKPNQLIVTSFRPTANGTLQVELCQKRLLAGRKRTVIGMVNAKDERFRDAHTTLFDWMKFEPEDILKVFPQLNKVTTVEELEKLTESYDPDAPTGSDAEVFQQIVAISHLIEAASGEKVTPIIAVTEVTHSQLLAGEFYSGPDADEKIQNELENGTSVMRTGSEDDAEYIVDPIKGDRIYRFTRTVLAEDYPQGNWDSIIQGKMTESAYKKAKAKKAVPVQEDYTNPADVVVGDDNL